MDEKTNAVIKEYVSVLKEDEVRNMHMRLDQNFSGDLESVLLTLQGHQGMDELLKSADNVKQFHAILDRLRQALDFEQKRFG